MLACHKLWASMCWLRGKKPFELNSSTLNDTLLCIANQSLFLPFHLNQLNIFDITYIAGLKPGQVNRVFRITFCTGQLRRTHIIRIIKI